MVCECGTEIFSSHPIIFRDDKKLASGAEQYVHPHTLNKVPTGVVMAARRLTKSSHMKITTIKQHQRIWLLEHHTASN